MARRKITDAKEAISELPELTAQEMALVEAKGAGVDNCEAYQRAYGAEGYSKDALKVRACRKLAEPRIQAWLEALNKVGFANALLTREAWLTLGMAKMAAAEASGNHGAAQGYWKDLGKALGFLTEQLEITHFDPISALEEIAKHSPDLARHLAQQANVPWQPEETRH